MKFRVVLIRDEEDGGFVVEVPELPGCITEGETVEECLKNAKEAIELHLECLECVGHPARDAQEPR